MNKKQLIKDLKNIKSFTIDGLNEIAVNKIDEILNRLNNKQQILNK